MSSRRYVAADFYVEELPHGQYYTPAEVDAYTETAARVLQPIRNRWGPVVPTSGLYWSSGTARGGAHAHAGTVDFVTPDANLRDVWEWGATYLVPAGYIGRWIYEPARAPDPETGQPGQGEHIHMAPRAAMSDVFGDRRIQVLEETDEGAYVLRYELAAAIGSIGALTLAAGAALLVWLRRRDALAL